MKGKTVFYVQDDKDIFDFVIKINNLENSPDLDKYKAVITDVIYIMRFANESQN